MYEADDICSVHLPLRGHSFLAIKEQVSLIDTKCTKMLKL